MRKAVAISSLALVHVCLSIGALSLAFSAGMARLETGHAPTILERTLNASVLALYFPLVQLSHLAPQAWFSGLWGYLPVSLNSALWAVVLVHVWSWLRTKAA